MSTVDYTFDPALIELVGGVARLRVPQVLGTILINQTFQAKALDSIEEVVNKTGSDNIKYQIKMDGGFLYFNGTAWVTSDQSFAQANTVAEINGNAELLIVDEVKIFQVQAILKGSGTTSPELNTLTVNFDYAPLFSTEEDECTVFCYLRDILNDDLTEAENAPTLIAVNDTPFINNGVVVPRFYREVDFVDTDFGLLASISLIQTEDSSNKIRFMISYEPYGIETKREFVRFRPVVIPAETQIDLVDLASIDTSQLI